MVCKLPQKVRDAIERHKECYRTATLTPEEGTARRLRGGRRVEGGGWAYYLPQCEESRKELMKRAGAHRLGSGVHRDVYRFEVPGDECVVKVANSDDPKALEANRNEWKAWKSAPSAAKKFLMPVDDADPSGWWLTMPLAGSPDTSGYEGAGGEPYQTRVGERSRTVRTEGGHTVRKPPGSPASGWRDTPWRARRTWTTVKTTGGGTAYTTIYPSGEGDEADAVGEHLQRELYDAGYDCSDVHGGNVGTYRGENVIIDYGMGLSARGQSSCQIVTPRTRRSRARPRPPVTLGRFR